MRFFIFSTFLMTALAEPARHVIHERRDAPPRGWVASYKMSADSMIPMKIGLVQSNLDRIEEFLMSVSDPESPNWSQHWSAEQVAKTFAPSKGTVEAVREWLTAAGIAKDRITHTPSKGWLKLNVTVEEAEALLHTKYHVYDHEDGETRQVGCQDYSIPQALQKHIDFITPTVHFDARVGSGRKKRAPVMSKRGLGDLHTIAQQGKTFQSIENLQKSLKNCTEYITPSCLRALYEIPVVTSNMQSNPLGVVEFTTQSYYQPDLDLFFDTFSKKQQQTTPNFKSIDGGFINASFVSFNIDGESNLDLEYAMSLVNPISVSVYQVGDAVEGGTLNTFLDAIDGSYCTFEGGDDPEDPKYPDPYGGAGAFEGPENCGGFAASKVISISYGYPTEYEFTVAYQLRQCMEYAKLGLMGTSILFATGDAGVGLDGTTTTCLASNSTFGNPQYSSNNKKSRFALEAPVNCPYVTAVGATQMKKDKSVLDQDPEEGAHLSLPQGGGPPYIYSSAGGFSDLFGVPNYQKAAVGAYFKNHKPAYGSRRYNSSGLSRGVPDVSANGANYTISVNGTFALVVGTSASTPTFASIIAIINEQRKAKGKKSIGFLNPMLYKNSEILNDITSGNNPNCGTNGFEAVTGWDPVTGLGTPNVPRMLEVFLKMA